MYVGQSLISETSNFIQLFIGFSGMFSIVISMNYNGIMRLG